MVTTATHTRPVVQYGVAMVPRPERSPLGELLRENDSMMRAVAYRMVGANRLDDTLQEAYLRAVRSYGTFRGQSSFRTWLYQIVHNTCVDVIRRDRRHQVVTGTDGPGLERAASDQPSSVFGQPEGSEIEQALAELPEDQRVAMTLVGIVGLSYDEAAEILGVPRGTVATRVHRGRADLKRALSEEVK